MALSWSPENGVSLTRKAFLLTPRSMSSFPLLDCLPPPDERTSDALLDAFCSYVATKNLELYPAQEEAILTIFSDQNVILNTPTGSGKSLVATAMHFRSLALGRRSIYTCPIKALVNEKFLALCREFGPEHVGMATGDATVNPHAPILCCTAEILANYALRDGADSPFSDVIMDEFHYYSDRERGVAWQIPLLTMAKSRFLLMSATLGETAFFQRELSRLTGAPTALVAGTTRPVPLEFRYSMTGIDETIADLLEKKQAPIYLVHFTQNDAAKAAQDLMSVNCCSTEEKARITEALRGVKFASPYGKEVQRYLKHGIGLHHAGLLPKYRILVEQLAQQGLLKLICGTDTLGVGVNVPIRTVLLTRLSKFDGEKTKILPSRDFHQITGRAGRRGFDNVGYVVCQAPEHVIENAKIDAKIGGDPRKAKKLVKKKAPDGFVGWSEETFVKLQTQPPEALSSRFQVSHSMLLQMFQRRGDACRAVKQLIDDSHEGPAQKIKHRKRARQLFRSLVERGLLTIIPPAQRQADGTKLSLHIELQEDFSLHSTLSLYLIDTIGLIDPASPNYALDVLSLCEAILENPEIILRRQLDRVKNDAMTAMKNDGVDYNERIQRLEELEYPKPCRDFIYHTFNQFAAQHPWIGQENIRPKSIAREMFENFRSFADYINDYDLHRVEGLLLRHLASVYKVLAQTVPEQRKNESLLEIEDWLAGVLRGTDSSLLEEWERLKNPDAQPKEPAPSPPPDITRNAREFTALIRTEIFRFLQQLQYGQYARALALVSHDAWTPESLAEAIDPYYDEHENFLLTTEARNGRHTHIEILSPHTSWKVSQVLVDPDELNDWQVLFSIDLAQARQDDKPTLQFITIEPIGR